jgi:hypothetical protein
VASLEVAFSEDRRYLCLPVSHKVLKGEKDYGFRG